VAAGYFGPNLVLEGKKTNIKGRGAIRQADSLGHDPEEFCMKKQFFTIAGVLAALLALMVLAGCASVPWAFETAGSLAGTTWETFPMNGKYSTLIINDAAAGVFTSADGKEMSFTYTAVYDAEKRAFTGTLTPTGGAEGAFSLEGGNGSVWKITAQGLGLNKESINYRSSESLQRQAERKRLTAEREEQFGALYIMQGTSIQGTSLNFRRDGDGMKVVFSEKGTFREDRSPDGSSNPGAILLAAQFSGPSYELRSKDSVTMTMLKRTNDPAYVDAEYSQTPSGTFKLSVSGNTVTISDGAGDGAKFNGAWKKQVK
jgi:hypothetical protein